MVFGILNMFSNHFKNNFYVYLKFYSFNLYGMKINF